MLQPPISLQSLPVLWTSPLLPLLRAGCLRAAQLARPHNTCQPVRRWGTVGLIDCVKLSYCMTVKFRESKILSLCVKKNKKWDALLLMIYKWKDMWRYEVVIRLWKEMLWKWGAMWLCDAMRLRNVKIRYCTDWLTDHNLVKKENAPWNTEARYIMSPRARPFPCGMRNLWVKERCLASGHQMRASNRTRLISALPSPVHPRSS